MTIYLPLLPTLLGLSLGASLLGGLVACLAAAVRQYGRRQYDCGYVHGWNDAVRPPRSQTRTAS